MIFNYVILLFLIWPQTRCVENANLKTEETLDQLAVASENVHIMRQSNSSSEDLREQSSSVPLSVDVMLRYENSNGFMPIISAITASYDNHDATSTQTNDLEQQDEQSGKNSTTNAVSAGESSSVAPDNPAEDLAYSSEVRIFLNPGSLTNRRSFDIPDKPNEFELLKVKNDTPAVANYQDFYENVRSTASTEIESGTNASPSSTHLNGKRIESHVRDYDRQSHPNTNANPHNRYYSSYSSAQDTKKVTYEREKVPRNYRQQDTANYNGHGQSVAGQNVATLSSSPRTNYEINEPTHGDTHGGTYDNMADLSRTRYRFSRPVVVAEAGEYKVDAKFNGQPRNDGASGDNRETSRKLEPPSTEMSNRHEARNGNSRQRSYHRSEDSKSFSDESADYTEYIERPRRLQKSRVRADSARKLPKEHRDSSEESAEVQQRSSPKSRSQRQKVRTKPWTNEPSADHHDDVSLEDVVKHDSRSGASRAQYRSRPKIINAWSEISPNLEISHSNGVELDQIERPKYIVPLNLNLVPVTNFDHATALGSSQGFDVSNAMMQNYVTAAPIGAFSTSAPLLSTPQSVLAQNFALAKNLANVQNLVATSAPDIIVGQSSFHNPMNTVLLPQQGRIADALKTAYLPSTMAPVFTLTSSLSPTLQSVRLQDHVTPRTAFAVTPTSTPVVQQLPIDQLHAGVQQLVVPQPTVQTFSNFLQTPLQTNSQYQIQVSPHGLQGQNVIGRGSAQMPNFSMTPVNFQSKKNTYAASDTGNFLATASLAVGQNEQKQALDAKMKAFAQATQTAPTLLQFSPTLNSMSANAQQLIPGQRNLQDADHVLQSSRDHQYVKMHNNGAEDAMQQLQMQLNRAQLMKNDNRLSSHTLQITDNTGGNSNSMRSVNLLAGNAHLPNMGTKNVEIVNPNIKPVDTTLNTFGAMHYPATVLTTPIPIFSTITPITPHTVNLQNYVSSLTESGTKTKQLGALDLKTSPQDRPMFNPANFVPNVDILKNQHVLNNKLPASEPLQQGLNLVPIVPGGNFFKPSFVAQSELVMKPKLASDLQKYAEEMFKESLKTIYNSQKWNNDRKPYGNNSEASDLARVQMELQKLKASMSGSKYKDILEAYHSENKLRLSDTPKSSSSDKKKDPVLMTLEHLLKTRPTGSIHIYHDSGRPSRKPGAGGAYDNFNANSRLKEFLTPPKSNPFHSMGPFHDKLMKKRPGASRYKNGLRKPVRPGSSPSRSNGLEASASNINLYIDGSTYRRSPFVRDNIDFDPRRRPPFDAYPTFTTSTPDRVANVLRELKASRNKDYDINHPRTHNLLGLLMKNKQLPAGNVQNYYRDKDQLRQFLDSEQRRLQQLFYDDVMKDFSDKYEGASQSGPIIDRKVYSGNGTA